MSSPASGWTSRCASGCPTTRPTAPTWRSSSNARTSPPGPGSPCTTCSTTRTSSCSRRATRTRAGTTSSWRSSRPTAGWTTTSPAAGAGATWSRRAPRRVSGRRSTSRRTTTRPRSRWSAPGWGSRCSRSWAPRTCRPARWRSPWCAPPRSGRSTPSCGTPPRPHPRPPRPPAPRAPPAPAPRPAAPPAGPGGLTGAHVGDAPDDQAIHSRQMAALVTTIRITFRGAPTFAKSVKRYSPVPKIIALVW
jgi:hypothetical protein